MENSVHLEGGGGGGSFTIGGLVLKGFKGKLLEITETDK